MLHTFRKNSEGYIKKQVEKDILDHTVQAMIGHSTKDKFKQMMRSKFLTNFPVRIDDITNGHTIFGPQWAGIWGKTLRKYKLGGDGLYPNPKIFQWDSQVGNFYCEQNSILTTLLRDIIFFTSKHFSSCTAK